MPKLTRGNRAHVRLLLRQFVEAALASCCSCSFLLTLLIDRNHDCHDSRFVVIAGLAEVDDCRKAIERDPKNIKALCGRSHAIPHPDSSDSREAYWRAARASLHLDLCRNGIDFCEAGLKQASFPQPKQAERKTDEDMLHSYTRPQDLDLIKLRDSCAEKLAGQQQRSASRNSFTDCSKLKTKAALPLAAQAGRGQVYSRP